jgi:predicted Abi (CAAX) family protease
MLRDYFVQNVVAGLTRAPSFLKGRVVLSFLLFASVSYLYGSHFGLFDVGLLDSKLVFILPLTLFVFPTLLEEIVFRGLLIPQNTAEKSLLQRTFYLFVSALLFVLWHPFNALTINTGAQGFFLNPHFLFIVMLLGLTCGYTYMHTKSLWVPVLIHWTTVIVWVFLLGGRNLILQ